MPAEGNPPPGFTRLLMGGQGALPRLPGLSAWSPGRTPRPPQELEAASGGQTPCHTQRGPSVKWGEHHGKSPPGPGKALPSRSTVPGGGGEADQSSLPTGDNNPSNPGKALQHSRGAAWGAPESRGSESLQENQRCHLGSPGRCPTLWAGPPGRAPPRWREVRWPGSPPPVPRAPADSSPEPRHRQKRAPRARPLPLFPQRPAGPCGRQHPPKAWQEGRPPRGSPPTRAPPWAVLASGATPLPFPPPAPRSCAGPSSPNASPSTLSPLTQWLSIY